MQPSLKYGSEQQGLPRVLGGRLEGKAIRKGRCAERGGWGKGADSMMHNFVASQGTPQFRR